MHPAHRITAAIALVAAPLLFATGEFLRLQVEGGVDYSQGDTDIYRAQIDAVAANPDAWLFHGMAVLIGTLAWALAVVAIIAVVGRSRPVLALVGGVLGLASAVAHGAHLGFYTVTMSVLGRMPADGRDAGVAVWGGTADDPLGNVLVLFFMVTFFVAPLVLAFGLWRERAMPWWAFALFVVGQLLMAGASDLVLGLGQLLWLPAMIFTGLRFGGVPRSAAVDSQPVRP
jgi:hypothetical protein